MMSDKDIEEYHNIGKEKGLKIKKGINNYGMKRVKI